MARERIIERLGGKAEYLLSHSCTTIDKKIFYIKRNISHPLIRTIVKELLNELASFNKTYTGHAQIRYFCIKSITMNIFASKIIIIALMLSSSYNLLAHVVLDYPQGGETFNWGETVNIQWHISIPHNTLNWDLFFSADGGTTWTAIQLDIPPGQLSYQWEVPDIVTSQGRVRVYMDNDTQDYLDISGNFNIEPITLPPMLDVAAMDTTIECNLMNQEIAIQAWLNNQGGAIVTNYCGDLNWTNDFTALSNGCGASGGTVVTFTASDGCGNTTTNAILTIVDSDAPVIDLLAIDRIVECNGNGNIVELNNWLNSRGGAHASDACGNVSWTNNYSTLSNGCGMTGNATVIFTATDECGNSVTTTATFTIEDNVAPGINVVAQNITIECGASDQAMIIQSWLNSRGGAQASDACGNVTWTNNYSNMSNGCGGTGSVSVTFTATDECGNNSTTTATLTINDSVAPGIDVAAKDTTMGCGAANQEIVIQNWLNNRGGAQASDACGDVIWTNNYSNLTNSCGATGSASVIFTATDECGNSINTTATLTIEDKLAPGIDEVAQDTTIECGSANQAMIIQNWLGNHGGARASDICGSVNWTNDFPVLSDTCSSTFSLTITFTVFDECGNSSTTNATFTVLGTSATSTPNFPDFDFKIYPNPVSELLKIDFNKNESLLVHLALFDASGRPLWIYQDRAMEIVIPVSQYASGVYFLQVETERGVFSRKVIIE